MAYRLRLFFIISQLITAMFCHAQQVSNKTDLVKTAESLRKQLPREKLYVQTDRDVCVQGDTLWFKAYLVEATTNQNSVISGLAHFEVINNNNEIVDQLSLPITNGMAWSGFGIKNDYPAGSYTLRAYTNWMRNFKGVEVFKKEFKVINANEVQQTNTEGKTSLLTEKPVATAKNRSLGSYKKIDLQFLPEGGQWIAGIIQRMAFKMIDINGKGINEEGAVFDQHHNQVAIIKPIYKGMGYFDMQPKANETYTAAIKTPAGIINYDLPKVQPTGNSLRVVNNFGDDSVRFDVQNNGETQRKLILIGQSRGVVCFVAAVASNQTSVKIAKNIFPTGTCQAVLMDEGQKPINQRAFFINHDDALNINLQTDDKRHSTRDSIPLMIRVTDKTGKPVVGSFSIAVIDDGQVKKDSVNDENILSWLLLSSDLKGNIETPGYYFNKNDETTHKALETLMLTQGWVNYNWEVPKKLFNTQQELEFTGQVTNLLKPVPNAKMVLFGKNHPIFYMDTVTNATGEFTFHHFPALDSAVLTIRTLNAKGKSGALGITLNEDAPMPVDIQKHKPILTADEPADTIMQNPVTTLKQIYKPLNHAGHFLNEVKIKDKKIIKGSKNLNGTGNADQILTEEEIAKEGKKSLLDLLYEKVKGFGQGSLKGDIKMRIFFLVKFSRAKFVIDGIDLDNGFEEPITTKSSPVVVLNYFAYLKSYLEKMSAEDIKGIEVMTSMKYFVAYLSEFDNAKKDFDVVKDETYLNYIEITTKRGNGPYLINKPANIYTFKPQPYGVVRQFYSPRYTLSNRNNPIPDYRPTLYWSPNVVTGVDGTAQVSFFSSDTKGNYTVWVEGADMQGSFGAKTLQVHIN